MPPKTNEQVLAESTNVAKQAAGMLGGTFEQGVGFQPGTIPASTLAEQPTAPVFIPQPEIPRVDANVALATADGLVNDARAAETRRLQQEQARAETKFTESERAIRQAFGVLGTEQQTRGQFEEQAGLPEMQRRIGQISNQLFNATNELRSFDQQFNIDMESMRNELTSSGVTARRLSGAAARATQLNALERASRVSDIYAMQGTLQLMQGNLEQATQAVDRALKAAYEPVRMQLEMETLFLQRNAQRLDAAESRVANARIKEIERQELEIDRAVATVDSAVASGYATEADIQRMTQLSGNPEAQREYAQNIVAKGAVQERILTQMAQNASISASVTNRRKNLVELAMSGDPQAISELGFDPGANLRELEMNAAKEEKAKQDKAYDTEVARLDKSLSSIEKLLQNNVGLTTSSGEFRNATISGFLGGQVMSQQAKRGATGQVIGAMPVLGNIVNSVSARQDKATWLAEMSQILTEEGFESLIKINERVRLTPITEMEVALAFRAASALQNAALYEGEGENRRFRGFSIPENEVRSRLAEMYLSVQKIQEETKGIQTYGYDGYVRLQELKKQSQ